MMSSGNANAIARYEPNVFDEKCFIWYFDKQCNNNTNYFSHFFQLCGYSCYLSFHYRNYENNFITLHASSSLLKNNISCRYLINLKLNSEDEDTFHTGTGKIQIERNFTEVMVHKNFFVKDFKKACIKFLWLDNGDYKISKQGVQIEPGISPNRIEKSTQTADIQFLNTDIRSNAVSSYSIIERATQTESTQASSENGICSCKERGSNKFLEILSKDLGSFYENKTDPDCVLRVDEVKFPVHRSVLASRSTVFAAMFHPDTSESQNGEVNILGVDAGALDNALYFIYTGKVRGLCPETAASMYVVSDKYALIDLRKECLNHLTNNLSMENLCDAALLAHTHAETDLENNVLQFIEERLEEIIQNDNWKKFSDTHLKLANYLLTSAFIASKVKR